MTCWQPTSQAKLASTADWSQLPLSDSAVGPSVLGTEAMDVREALRETVCRLDGVTEIRLLARENRQQHPRHKAFVVLSTHDLKRDRQIIDLLVQFDDLDYDLVPDTAVGMIPDAADAI